MSEVLAPVLLNIDVGYHMGLKQQHDAERAMPLPEQIYGFVIESVETTSTSKGGQQSTLKLRVVDGPMAGKLVYDRIQIVNDNPKTAAIAQQQLAAYAAAQGWTYLQYAEQLQGTYVDGKVRTEKGTGGYEDQSRIREVYRFNSQPKGNAPAIPGPAGMAAPAATPPVQAPQQGPQGAPQGGPQYQPQGGQQPQYNPNQPPQGQQPQYNPNAPQPNAAPQYAPQGQAPQYNPGQPPAYNPNQPPQGGQPPQYQPQQTQQPQYQGQQPQGGQQPQYNGAPQPQYAPQGQQPQQAPQYQGQQPQGGQYQAGQPQQGYQPQQPGQPQYAQGNMPTQGGQPPQYQPPQGQQPQGMPQGVSQAPWLNQ